MSRIEIPEGVTPDQIYVPVNRDQVSHLVGKMLTHIESMNLSERAEEAHKSLVRQSLWAWFDEALENSRTSYKGCIAPIVAEQENDPNQPSLLYVWLTDADVRIHGNRAVRC